MEPTAGENPTSRFGLELWLARPGDLEETAIEEACTAILDVAERARASRFRFDRHRREYLATHALARVALSHSRALPPYAWRFAVNEHGKPSPIPECGVLFNQSNSLELVVCLIARPEANSSESVAEVGVDVESFSRAEEIVPLAVRVFSETERAQLDALPIAERADRALSLWTLKEAYIKARGMGLSLPLDGISFLFDGSQANGQATIRFQVAPGVDENPERWRFCRFDHAGHRIALAVEAAAVGTPEIFEARPPLAPATRLEWSSPAWFPDSVVTNGGDEA